jgi:hypothetical protein
MTVIKDIDLLISFCLFSFQYFSEIIFYGVYKLISSTYSIEKEFIDQGLMSTRQSKLRYKYMYIYIYVCICIYVYMYISIYIHIYMHIYMHGFQYLFDNSAWLMFFSFSTSVGSFLLTSTLYI